MNVHLSKIECLNFLNSGASFGTILSLRSYVLVFAKICVICYGLN